MNFRLLRWGLLLVACILLVPVLIYIAGGLLVGPYEGESGLMGLIMSLYSDALRGKLSTWFLLISPMLLVLIWLAGAWLQSSITERLAEKP